MKKDKILVVRVSDTDLWFLDKLTRYYKMNNSETIRKIILHQWCLLDEQGKLTPESLGFKRMSRDGV